MTPVYLANTENTFNRVIMFNGYIPVCTQILIIFGSFIKFSCDQFLKFQISWISEHTFGIGGLNWCRCTFFNPGFSFSRRQRPFWPNGARISIKGLIKQFFEYPSLPHNRHFNTSFPHKGRSFSAPIIFQFHTNPSVPHDFISSTRHFHIKT